MNIDWEEVIHQVISGAFAAAGLVVLFCCAAMFIAGTIMMWREVLA